MRNRIPEERRIRQDEAVVVRAALERAPVSLIHDAVRATVSALEVVGRCDCGCASVDFASPAWDQRSTVIADGTGTTPRGGQVGIMVWGRPDAITGLEVYDRGAGDDDLMLPVPTSVIPW